MPLLRKVREMLCIAYNFQYINEVEFALLYDINKSILTKHINIPYWQYNKFELENMTDDESRTEFRFEKDHIFNLVESLQLDEEQTIYNRLKVDSSEAVCIRLKRLSYPCRYTDMIPRFARPAPEICAINNHMITLIHNQWGFLLQDLNRESLAPENLQRHANALYNKGAPLNNCWGFVDGTVRPVSRPGQNQRAVYNGHKRVHAITFQLVATPDGLVALLHGPYEGKSMTVASFRNLVCSEIWSNSQCLLMGKFYAFMEILLIPYDPTFKHLSKGLFLLTIKSNGIKT